MSAMRIIDDIHKKNGKVISFTSYCGGYNIYIILFNKNISLGLPAPENNDNPFGYKLAWAPRGVLLASKNDAHFIKNGKDIFIPGKDLFDNFETGI